MALRVDLPPQLCQLYFLAKQTRRRKNRNRCSQADMPGRKIHAGVPYPLDSHWMTANPSSMPVTKHVLLVDDEIDLLNMISTVLREAGYEVQCATNGREGLAHFGRRMWDAVIVDRSMPEMNGEQLAETIRHYSPRVPLMMITGLTAAVSRPELFDLILAKPFRRGELLACLARLWRGNPVAPIEGGASTST